MLNKVEQSFCETESFQSMQFIESNPKISNKCYGWNKVKIGKIFTVVAVVIFVGALIWYQTTRIDELNAKLHEQNQSFFSQSESLKTVTKNLSKGLSDLQIDQNGHAKEMKKTKATLEDHQQSLDNHAGKLDFHYRASSAEDCEELFEHGINVSGPFNIDPDGRYQGMHSFEVICDFEMNVTKIQPMNKLIKILSSSTVVEYSPTMDQIRYLIKHSGSCYQEISVQNVSLQNVFWLDFKGRERNFSDGFEGKVRLWNFWLLPITGVGLKSLHNNNTSVTFDIGDVTCSQTIYVNITGSVYDAFPDVRQLFYPSLGRHFRSISWKPRKVPIIFNIEFDIEVLEWKSETKCYAFLAFSVDEDINDEHVFIPIIRYCAYDKLLRIIHFNQYSFEGSPKTTTEIDLSTIGKSTQHVQVKQFMPNNPTCTTIGELPPMTMCTSTTFYFVKFGHKVLYSGETKRVWNNKDELFVGIYSLYENDGARVTNLMITE